MKRILYVLVAVVAAFLGLTVALKNSQPVELRYYYDLGATFPLSMVLLITFVFGVLCGFLANLKVVLSAGRKLTRARKEVRQMEQEVVNLRSLPIKDAV